MEWDSVFMYLTAESVLSVHQQCSKPLQERLRHSGTALKNAMALFSVKRGDVRFPRHWRYVLSTTVFRVQSWLVCAISLIHRRKDP